MNKHSAPGNMSHSQLVRSKIDMTCAPAVLAFREFWEREDLTDAIPGFLVTLQQIMRATVPLMEAARDRCAELADTDPLAAQLHDYYAKHVTEEQDHDVWALDDLEAVGYDRAEVEAMLPLPDVASLMGAQYYWIHHFHPVMMLGCIAVLEGGPPTQALIDKMERASGLPAEAFRTYRFHGEVDVHHLKDLDDALDGFDLSQRDLGLISISATHTAKMLAEIMPRISASDAPERKVAA